MIKYNVYVFYHYLHFYFFFPNDFESLPLDFDLSFKFFPLTSTSASIISPVSVILLFLSGMKNAFGRAGSAVPFAIASCVG